MRPALESRVSRVLLAVEDFLDVEADLARPAARALLGVGVQEDLHGGVRRDDAADVAAFGDPVAGG